MPRSEAQKRADKKYEAKRKGTRKNKWWGYLYFDSAPEDWKQRCRDCGVEGFAVVHDKDVRADDSVKKSHAHILLRFSHAVNRKEAAAVLTEIGVLEKSIQSRDNWRAAARYLCHMDDPDKYQYPQTDIIEFGGSDYHDAITRASDKYQIIADMEDWIDENHCFSFRKFSQYCRKNEPDWFYAICDNCTIVIREYIKSARYDWLDEDY